MVDDFMVYVDRVISSACLETVKGRLLRRGLRTEMQENLLLNNNVHGSVQGEGHSTKRVLIECRICQEEDEEKELESPCGCNGTLKFAHRKCIQKWCNKKGDITCEICNQVYAPNYSIPQSIAGSDCLTIDIRQNWGSRVDLHDPHILAIAAVEHQLLQAEYEDYGVANTGGIGCCRSVALILMLLLLIRHALTITRDFGLLEESLTAFDISLLQFAGLLLPCYVILRALHILQNRRRR